MCSRDSTHSTIPMQASWITQINCWHDMANNASTAIEKMKKTKEPKNELMSRIEQHTSDTLVRLTCETLMLISILVVLNQQVAIIHLLKLVIQTLRHPGSYVDIHLCSVPMLANSEQRMQANSVQLLQ